MGHRTDLLNGLGRWTAAAGIATWNQDGVYTAGQTGITIGAVPANPPRLLVLTGYGVADHPHLTDDVQGVQVRGRWDDEDPRPVDDLLDAVFDRWQAARDLTLPTGVRVIYMTRQSSVSLGQDDNRRWQRADNYYVTTWRPSSNRI